MSLAHRFYASLLGGAPPISPTHVFDWNPTEGSGTVITDKNGSGVDLTTNGVWVSSGNVRYDHTGIFNFLTARVTHPALTMVRSSVLMYVKLPALWTGGFYLGGHRVEQTHTTDRKLTLDGPVSASPVRAGVTQAAGPNTLKSIQSVSTFTQGDEFVCGWTHDGSTLRIYINGVDEGNVACSDSVSTTPAGFLFPGGLPPFSDREPPSSGGIFSSPGAIIGRVLAANYGFSGAEVASYYAEYQSQYPGLP